MTISVALFDCPHCIDEFAFDYQKIAKLNYGWRVRVRCPDCGNVVEVIMLNYTLIHGCEPDKYKGERSSRFCGQTRIFRMNGGWRLTLSDGRFSKSRVDGVLSHAVENHDWKTNDGLLI